MQPFYSSNPACGDPENKKGWGKKGNFKELEDDLALAAAPAANRYLSCRVLHSSGFPN